jgi:hypothetical protein
MKTSKNQLINKLHQLPRHGMARKVNLANMANMYKAITESVTGLKDSEAARATGLSKMIGFQQRVQKQVLDQIAATTKLEERNAGLNKAYGLTSKQAAAMGHQLDKLSKDLKAGRTQIDKYFVSLNKMTGGLIRSVKGTKEQQKAMNENVKSLTKQQRYYKDIIGLTDEAAEKIQLYNASQTTGGKTAIKQMEKIVVDRRNEAKALEKITGIRGVQKTIESEIAATSAQNLFTFSRMPKELSVAVLKAKALGMSLDGLAKTGDHLLNIEQSVSEEMNLQLLSGERLVNKQGESLTNSYRRAYLEGNANKMANILYESVEKMGGKMEGNLMLRKQFAKTYDIELEQVNKMMQKRKLLQGIGAPELFKLSGDDLEKELKSMRLGAETLEKIMESDDTGTTLKRSEEYLQSIVDEGIYVQNLDLVGPDLEFKPITFTNNIRKSITGAGGVVDQIKSQFGEGSSFATEMSEASQNIGNMTVQRFGHLFATSKEEGLFKEFKDFGTAMGGVTSALGDFVTKLQNKIPTMFVKAATGTKLEDMTVPTESVTVNKATELVEGGVVPPGYPNDTFAARLTSGETVIPRPKKQKDVIPLSGNYGGQDMAVLAKEIVKALASATFKVESPGYSMQSGRH